MIENIKAILSNWDDVRIEQNPVYWTIGGVFKGTAHAGTRADPLSLARDLARIAGSDVQPAPVPVVEPAPVAEPEPVAIVEPEPVLEIIPEPEPKPDNSSRPKTDDACKSKRNCKNFSMIFFTLFVTTTVHSSALVATNS